MDHVRGVHDVPWDVKSPSLEKFVPPWTFQHKVWSDSLMANHSGISTDVLLFGDINLSLTESLSGTQAQAPAYCFQKGLLDSSSSLYGRAP